MAGLKRLVEDRNAFGVGTLAPAADKRYRPLGLADSIPKRGVPTMVKYARNPVYNWSQSWAASIVWFWVVKVDGLIANPLGKYYGWYSTDHVTGGGEGIGLAFADSPYGPWTDYGARIFRDTTSGGVNTETPSVVWNPDTSLFHMYYQQLGVPTANGSQSTMLATSPDGITWTIVGIAIDVPAGNQTPGDGHTGYFRPFRIGQTWYGYHLMGGGTHAHQGISYSRDGIAWITDPRPLMYGSDQIASESTLQWRIGWSNANVFEWRGRLWVIVSEGPTAAGGLDINLSWFAAPLAPDLRHFAATPIDITPAFQTWENSLVYPMSSVITTDDGKLVGFYRGNGPQGGFGLCELELP